MYPFTCCIVIQSAILVVVIIAPEQGEGLHALSQLIYIGTAYCTSNQTLMSTSVHINIHVLVHLHS